MNADINAKEIGKKVDSSLTQLAEKVSDKAHVAQEKVMDASKYVADYIKEHPIKSTVIAGAACYLLGRLMK